MVNGMATPGLVLSAPAWPLSFANRGKSSTCRIQADPIIVAVETAGGTRQTSDHLRRKSCQGPLKARTYSLWRHRPGTGVGAEGWGCEAPTTRSVLSQSLACYVLAQGLHSPSTQCRLSALEVDSRPLGSQNPGQSKCVIQTHHPGWANETPGWFVFLGLSAHPA